MRPKEIDRALERFDPAVDALEEIVSDACKRDGFDYFKFLKLRMHACDGRIYLAIRWYGKRPPGASVIYAPDGFWISTWYKTEDDEGNVYWQCSLEEGA